MDIKAQYEHSKFGTFMFNLCASWTKFLVKHKWLFYLLACTWGIIMTIIGGFVTVGLAIGKIFDKNIKFSKFYWVYNIKAGSDYWGGFETGLMFVRDQKSGDSYINDHEFGHTFQNCLFGPVFVFLSLSSAARYWYQEIRTKKGKDNKPYDQYWLEDAASQCGKYVSQYINNNNKKWGVK